MYSAVSRPPRVAGARPSSRSDERKRRCPSISCGVMRGACAAAGPASSAAASAGISVRLIGNLGDEDRWIGIDHDISPTYRGVPAKKRWPHMEAGGAEV